MNSGNAICWELKSVKMSTFFLWRIWILTNVYRSLYIHKRYSIWFCQQTCVKLHLLEVTSSLASSVFAQWYLVIKLTSRWTLELSAKLTNGQLDTHKQSCPLHASITHVIVDVTCLYDGQKITALCDNNLIFAFGSESLDHIQSQLLDNHVRKLETSCTRDKLFLRCKPSASPGYRIW